MGKCHKTQFFKTKEVQFSKELKGTWIRQLTIETYQTMIKVLKQLHCIMFRLCKKIWKDKHVTLNWNEVIIKTLHKKGDKTVCEIYRGILFLNSTNENTQKNQCHTWKKIWKNTNAIFKTRGL
jgi:hypothetical protein